MAAFDRTAEHSHPVDYQLVADGFVTMFWADHVLEGTLKWLSVNGYQILTLQAGAWRQRADLHRDVAEGLHFPDYYGRNLDALNDCLRDVAVGDYGLDASATGFVLVLAGSTRSRRSNRLAPKGYWTSSPTARGTLSCSGNG